jgi:predicted ester cyclase
VRAVVADESSVAVRLDTTWTQRGDFLGVPADGRRLALRSMDLYRVRDGRISESWHVEDLAGVLRRLG